MKRRIGTYVVLLLTLTAVLVSMIPVASADFLQGYTLTEEELYDLMDQVTLHPQKTGYAEMDQWLDEFYAQYEGMDIVQKLKATYEWLIKNVIYSWWPYTGIHVGYDDFNVDHHLTYDDELQEVIPYEIVNRAYHAMTKHLGVCYDFAAALTVMTRYLGFDCYSHYGETDFQRGCGGEPVNRPHGWCILYANGEKFLLDPEMDYKLSGDGKRATSYMNFFVVYDTTWRYTPDEKALAADKLYLPVAEHRHHKVRVRIEASPSGSADVGTRVVWDGERTTLHAGSEPGFYGWYGPDGTICSPMRTYSPAIGSDSVYKAVFNQEYFNDVSGHWYEPAAKWGWTTGLIEGGEPYIFNGEGKMTRAMAAQTLYRLSGERTRETQTRFSDVAPDAWYSRAVAWCTESGVVNGMSETEFCPDADITREAFITMLMRYADCKGICGAEPEELHYGDSSRISDYAREPMERAQAMGLIGGYDDGSIRPLGRISRAECVTMIRRLETVRTEK